MVPAGFESSEIGKYLRESLHAQYGCVVGDLIFNRPELFSGARQAEMEALAAPHLKAAEHNACVAVLSGRGPELEN